MGRFRLSQLAKRVIKSQFECTVRAKAARFSQGDFRLVVQALHDPAGSQFLSAEIVEDQLPVLAQGLLD